MTHPLASDFDALDRTLAGIAEKLVRARAILPAQVPELRAEAQAAIELAQSIRGKTDTVVAQVVEIAAAQEQLTARVTALGELEPCPTCAKFGCPPV